MTLQELGFSAAQTAESYRIGYLEYLKIFQEDGLTPVSRFEYVKWSLEEDPILAEIDTEEEKATYSQAAMSGVFQIS